MLCHSESPNLNLFDNLIDKKCEKHLTVFISPVRQVRKFQNTRIYNNNNNNNYSTTFSEGCKVKVKLLDFHVAKALLRCPAFNGWLITAAFAYAKYKRVQSNFSSSGSCLMHGME